MSYLIIKDELTENVSKALKYMGKAMSCIEEMENGSEMGERNYSRYDNRYGMRERYPDFDEMGERRGVPGTGRYRY